ncbi:MAG TPA: methyltransferase domain-containing protein [Rhizomicrobium sp.]|nr:methyltransferase domain-containing protein [Rhizomicrobium sp.]
MHDARPPLFDPTASAHARRRALKLAGDRFLDKAAADGLADRLGAVTRKFARGLWIVPASGSEPSDKPVPPPQIAPFAAEWVRAEFGADEGLQAKGGFDLAVSLFSLQTLNDLPGALVQVRRALRPDGLFVAALLGGNTLTELRGAFAHAEIQTRGGVSPRVSPFADVRDLGGLLQRAGFALPVADVERLTVRYGDFFALVRDLRAHGFTNILAERSPAFLRRDTLAALLACYAGQHSDDDGRLRARFETVYLTGWSPHESQQQPLTPGSAKARLAEALGADEVVISGSKTPG